MFGLSKIIVAKEFVGFPMELLRRRSAASLAPYSPSPGGPQQPLRYKRNRRDRQQCRCVSALLAEALMYSFSCHEEIVAFTCRKLWGEDPMANGKTTTH